MRKGGMVPPRCSRNGGTGPSCLSKACSGTSSSHVGGSFSRCSFPRALRIFAHPVGSWLSSSGFCIAVLLCVPPGPGPVRAGLIFGVLNLIVPKGRVKFMCSRRCPWWRPRLGSQGSSSMRGDPAWVVLCRSSSMRGGIYSKKTQDDALFFGRGTSTDKIPLVSRRAPTIVTSCQERAPEQRFNKGCNISHMVEGPAPPKPPYAPWIQAVPTQACN